MRTIAHISDIHFGKIDPRIEQGLLVDLSQRKADLLVVSGDLTQRARSGQYRAAAEYLQKLPKPQLVVPGNHDVPLYDLPRRFISPLGQFRQFITANLSPVFRDEEIMLVGINTARPFSWRLKGFWKDGGVSPAQLELLREQFHGVPESVFKVVVTHHPFIPPSPQHAGDIVHGAAAALQTMQSCGVDLLLAGHLHEGYHGDVRSHHEGISRSMISVQAGTATSVRRRNQANGYNWITIEPDSVKIEIRAWSGEFFAPATQTHFVRIGGVWQLKV